MYSYIFAPRAYRLFKKLDAHIKKEFLKHLQQLNENPMAGESLEGKFKKFRSYHFGYKSVSYRIVYAVKPDEQVIVIQLADKRENLYKRLEVGNV